MRIRKLPTFAGYTVDYRLRQFRRFEIGKRPEIVPFESPKGQRLLSRLRMAR